MGHIYNTTDPTSRLGGCRRLSGSSSPLADGKIDASPLVTGTVGLDVVAAAFDTLAHPEHHCKVIIDPQSAAGVSS